MRPVEGELLRILAANALPRQAGDGRRLRPVEGRTVLRAVPRLEDAGFIASVPHGTEFISPVRRFHLTATGVRRLAQDENAISGGPVTQPSPFGPVEATPP